MRRRVIGLMVAAVLAAAAVFVIARYVQDAADREAAGEEVSDVYVVTAFVPAGTAADELGGSVRLTPVPASSVVDGAVTDFDQLAGLVATADLLPNEQLSVHRFGAPGAVARAGSIEIPEDHVEVSINVSPDRSVGGGFRPGDRATVVAVFDADDQGGNRVQVLLSNLLVTEVRGDQPAILDPADLVSGADIPAVPTGNYLVTVAVDGPALERLVFAVEYGRLYLAREPIDGAALVSGLVTGQNVLGTVPS